MRVLALLLVLCVACNSEPVPAGNGIDQSVVADVSAVLGEPDNRVKAFIWCRSKMGAEFTTATSWNGAPVVCEWLLTDAVKDGLPSRALISLPHDLRDSDLGGVLHKAWNSGRYQPVNTVDLKLMNAGDVLRNDGLVEFEHEGWKFEVKLLIPPDSRPRKCQIVFALAV